MKLIIDIDKDILTDAKNGHIRLSEIADAVIKTGTPVNIGEDTISRSALKERIITRLCLDMCPATTEEDTVLEEIDNAPTVEYPFYAEAYQTGYEEGKNEKPQGKWECKGYKTFYCNKCNKKADDRYDFCPNCGAKMKHD